MTRDETVGPVEGLREGGFQPCVPGLRAGCPQARRERRVAASRAGPLRAPALAPLYRSTNDCSTDGRWTRLASVYPLTSRRSLGAAADVLGSIQPLWPPRGVRCWSPTAYTRVGSSNFTASSISMTGMLSRI